MARPTEYKPHYTVLAYNYCLLGATDIQLAQFFCVSEKTLNSWKKHHPEFLQSIKRGKDEADAVIAESLFHRAKGYSHEDVEIKVVPQGGKMGSAIETVPVIKHYPPDTLACIFWLKNRQKDRWRDKTETEHTGAVEVKWLD